MRRITIFDTTLRDGEQSPGASLNHAEKIEIARALERLGVDVIEAGFPIASEDDFEAVRAVAAEVRDVIVCGLARTVAEDIDHAGRAVEKAARPRIHIFCATSEIHLKYKLRKAREEILRMTIEGVKKALQYVDDVEFSPEDASRTEPDFLVEVVAAAVKAGATTVNIPDTVGYSVPEEYAGIISHLRENVPGIEDVVISVHCHNDLGLAVANSLAAVAAGASQVECTINGLGERAGNAALEEVVMAMRTRADRFADCETGVDSRRLLATSRLVSSLTGLHVQRNKAIVGDNAFAHEAGIHQDGVLKERTTYEIMRPEDVGFGETRLVLGKHSGRHAFRDRCSALGYELTDEQVDSAFVRFKRVADRKKEIFDDDIEALIEEEIAEITQEFLLESLHVSSGTTATPTATVKLTRATGETGEDAAIGDGPVDAACKAIERITGIAGRLTDYQIRAVTGGKDALGEVNLEVEINGRRVRGRAVSTDVIEASALAYLNAVNRFIAHRGATPGKGEQPSA